MEEFQQLIEQNKYYYTFDRFLEDHPEIDPEWRGFMEPVFAENERKLFSYLLQLR